MKLSRRSLVGAALAAPAILSRRALAAPFTASADLVAAARKEGKMVYYTASFTEVEQEVINAFNKRFPFVRIEMVLSLIHI